MSDPRLDRRARPCTRTKLFPLYGRVAELDIPLLFMAGPLAGPDISHTDSVRLARVARRYSTMPVILGQGCYPFVTETVSLAFKSEVTGLLNVFVSPDVYMFAPGAQAYVEGLNWRPKRFVFASAYSFCGVEESVRETLKLPIKDEALLRNVKGAL